METSSGGTSGSAGTQSTGDLIREQVSQGTHSAADKTQQVAGQVTQQAKSQAQTIFQNQKQSVTQNLSNVSEALRTTGNTLEAQNLAPIATVIDAAADRLDGVTTYLENADLDSLLQDAESFARRNQPLFLGSTFALGLLAARFLKSSAPRPSYGQTRMGNYGGPGSFGSESSYGTSTAYGSGYGSGYGSASGYGAGSGYTDSYGAGVDYGSDSYGGNGSYSPVEDTVVTGMPIQGSSFADDTVTGIDTPDSTYSSGVDTGANNGTTSGSY
jgi:hypothetical protein